MEGTLQPLGPRAEQRELQDLWVSVGVAFSLCVYFLLDTVGRLLAIDEIGMAVRYGLFAWTLGLLWIAYQRWRNAERNRGELSNILQSISAEVVLVVDKERRIEMVNESARRVFDISPDDVLGKTTDVLYPDRRAHLTSPGEIRDALDRTGFHVGEAVGQNRNRGSFPIEITTALLRKGGGAVILLKDITDRKQAEAAILKARQDAEDAHAAKTLAMTQLEENFKKLQSLEKLRDNLTHMIVHDMRTPLQVVLGNAQLLEEESADKSGGESNPLVSELTYHTRTLIAMANDLLDVSRLENGQFPLSLETHDIVSVAHESLGLVEALVRSRNLSVAFDAPAEPFRATFDAQVIRRVIMNLLTNAIKYTPENGQFCLGIRRVADHVSLSVKDSGPGIAPEHRDKIFEKFGQVSDGVKKQVHSAGLGLTFCKLAVEAHGGAIGVESAVGQGSTFWISLPAT